MDFRRFIESIETRYWRYRQKLQDIFPGEDDEFYDSHMQRIISIEKQSTLPVDDYNDVTFNKYVDELMDQTNRRYPRSYRKKHSYGSAYPTYEVGAKQKREEKNIWVKHSADPHNYQRILACQFSSPTLYTHIPGKADQYYDKLYSGVRSGYARPEDFWEIPRWIAVMSNSISNVDLYVIRDIDEAVDFFRRAKYKFICFSVLDINKDKVEQIALSE